MNKEKIIELLLEQLGFYRNLLSTCKESDNFVVEGCLYEIRKIKNEIEQLRANIYCKALF